MTLIWASHKLFEHLQVRKADSTRCGGHWLICRYKNDWSSIRISYDDDWPVRQHGEKLRREA